MKFHWENVGATRTKMNVLRHRVKLAFIRSYIKLDPIELNFNVNTNII